MLVGKLMLLQGSPSVVSTHLVTSKYSEKEIYKFVAVAESNSEHLLAAALLHEAEERGLLIAPCSLHFSR